MSGFWLVLLLALNFGISWWNAVVAGKTWIESKSMGNFIRIVTWSAAIQSACGFTFIFMCGIAGIGYVTGLIGNSLINLMLHMTYLLIILPILGSGLVITIHSWIAAYRDRSILSMGEAAYNTFAMAHNAYGAVDGISNAISAIGNAMDSEDDNIIFKALVLTLLASVGGILLTRAIILKYAGTLPIPSYAPA